MISSEIFLTAFIAGEMTEYKWCWDENEFPWKWVALSPSAESGHKHDVNPDGADLFDN